MDELKVRALTVPPAVLSVAGAGAAVAVLSAVLGRLALLWVLVARVRAEVDVEEADGYLDCWNTEEEGEADGVAAVTVVVVYDGRRDRVVVLVLEVLPVLLRLLLGRRSLCGSKVGWVFEEFAVVAAEVRCDVCQWLGEGLSPFAMPLPWTRVDAERGRAVMTRCEHRREKRRPAGKGSKRRSVRGRLLGCFSYYCCCDGIA